MGGIFGSIGKIIGAVAPFVPGPIGTAMTIASTVAGVAGASKPKASAVTGMTASAADTTETAKPDAAETERQKRLALNAQGSSGTTTSPLGVTAKATVTKRNLLGL